jgi:hypothetical protein
MIDCLKIFLKRDELEWSGTEDNFNEIFPDQEKRKNFNQVLIKFQWNQKVKAM